MADLGIKLSARQLVVPPPRPEHGAARSTRRSPACAVAMDNADRYYLTPSEVARTIFVDTDHVSATDFHITAEQRQTLYANGQQAASAWLAARNADTRASHGGSGALRSPTMRSTWTSRAA